MPDHSTPLIGTIAVGLVLAYAFGLLAQRLRLQPLVGYLVAGIVVGPFTPGFVADQKLAVELAEIGVILLMFGVGLHISIKDLASVARIAVPGAIGQIAATTAMGAGIALSLGWDVQSGLLFGFALSVASTVVLVCMLQEHHIIDTQRGRIAVGWVIVEDLVMIVAFVLLPAIAGATVDGGGSIADTAAALALTIGKIAAFVALMLLVGPRVIPWLMHHTAHTGSRELFRLAVYASAIGIAYGPMSSSMRHSPSARSSPGWFSARPACRSVPPRKRCRFATPLPSCSSCRSECSSIRRSWWRSPSLSSRRFWLS